MALVVIGSAKGSPGVTTLALALAALWPRPVLLADCDVAGGDVALRLPAEGGGPLDPDRGLVSLAAAGRNGLPADLILAHTQRVTGGLDVLAGLRTPGQAVGLEAFWPALAVVAPRVPGIDVVADVGRFGADSPFQALVRAAQLVLVVARPTVSSVVHVRERLGGLVAMARSSPTSGQRIGVVLVTSPAQRRDASSVVATLAAAPSPPDQVWQVAFDPQGAAVFEGAAVRRPERSDLIRSAATVAAQLAAVTAGSPLSGGAVSGDALSGDAVPGGSVSFDEGARQ